MAIKSYESPVRYDRAGDSIIQMRGITKTFHTTAGETPVLKGIDFDVLQGQFVGVIGRSGSGKSTLVNMITGIDHPSSGVVKVGGMDIRKMNESAMALWRGKNLGIVFQFFQLLPMLTLVENVMLPMDFCNIYPPGEREERALSLLRLVGLERMADTLPGAIAGGQQQCAAVARALANDPPILIADEPTGNLDSNTADKVMEIFEGLTVQGKTVLIVTHDRTLVKRTDKQLIISDGELVNEHLVAAFPDIEHSRLLQLSKQATSLQLEPGAYLRVEDPANAPIYLVTRGEMVCESHGMHTPLVAGCFVEPLSSLGRMHAGDKGAALLVFPRQDAYPLLPRDSRQGGNPEVKINPSKNDPDQEPYASTLA